MATMHNCICDMRAAGIHVTAISSRCRSCWTAIMPKHILALQFGVACHTKWYTRTHMQKPYVLMDYLHDFVVDSD